MEKKLSGFTLLRLIAAIQVVYVHLINHLHLPQLPLHYPPDLFRILSPFEGVPLFFSLSGYFLWKSLSEHPLTFPEFARRRVVRIFPELWIITGCTALVLLLLYSPQLEAIPFLAWIAGQITFLQFWTPSCLTGFGVGCPNGSLWTITIFLQFYLVVIFLHRLLHGSKPRRWILALLVCAILNCVPRQLEPYSPIVLTKLYQQTIFPYLSVFLFAAMVAEYERFLQPILEHSAVTAVLYFALYIGLPFDLEGSVFPLLRPMVICLFAVSFGLSVRFPILKEDISYEIYLVHMPVVNVLLELTANPNWTTFLTAAAVIPILALCLFFLNKKILSRINPPG